MVLETPLCNSGYTPQGVPGTVWTQDVDEVHLLVPVPQEVHKADVHFKVFTGRLELAINKQDYLTGSLDKPVNPEGCFWNFEEDDGSAERFVHVTLEKAVPGYQSWSDKDVLVPLNTKEQ